MLAIVLQILIALGLFNVWLLRARSSTSYRGGDAQTLRQEFAAYGLPPAIFYLVGALKLTAATLLIVGLWLPSVVLPAALIVLVLMIGALAMHLKVKDPLERSLPAFLMLLMSATLAALYLT
ncbi:MAG: DoxX family protein [Planctomycetota bacterium]